MCEAPKTFSYTFIDSLSNSLCIKYCDQCLLILNLNNEEARNFLRKHLICREIVSLKIMDI